MKIPELYETNATELIHKIIYEKWEIPEIKYFWLIAEYSPEKELGFGYSNLNDDELADWGYISIPELKDVGAQRTENWTPKTFFECMREIVMMRLDRRLRKEG